MTQPIAELIEEVLTKIEPIYGRSHAGLERVFELEQVTLAKVIGGAIPEPIGLRGLLNIVKTFPWIIAVAEENFDEKYARKVLLHMAIEEIAANPESAHDYVDKS